MPPNTTRRRHTLTYFSLLRIIRNADAISIAPGLSKADAPTEDRLEETWRRYRASIFDPARPKVRRSKRNAEAILAEPAGGSLIRPLIAAHRCMLANGATEPHKAQQRRGPSMKAKHPASDDSLEALREQAAHCRACPLWKPATQTVFGVGPPHAEIMLVGEQPGDKEDLAGKPFVGPAGQMLDRALKQAGINRNKVYVTNAVKHFKFVPRGKIRLHQKPNTPEIKACRQWYERELASIKPDLVVAMGATAAQSVLGKITPINRNRGRLIELEDGTSVLVTVHP